MRETLNAQTVSDVIQYLTYHAKVAPRTPELPLKTAELRTLVDDFDVQLLDGASGRLYDLMLVRTHATTVLRLLHSTPLSLYTGRGLLQHPPADRPCVCQGKDIFPFGSAQPCAFVCSW